MPKSERNIDNPDSNDASLVAAAGADDPSIEVENHGEATKTAGDEAKRRNENQS